jgi:hypothetical protein
LRKAYPILGVVVPLLAVLAFINVLLLGDSGERAIWSAWLSAIVLSMGGAVLIAVRPHPLIASGCFIASGLLVVVTALLLYSYIDDGPALITGLCALASLPLLSAGAVAIRRATRDRHTGREGTTRFRPAQRSATVVGVLGVVLPSILLFVLWALTSAFSEGAGLEQSARLGNSLWLLGTLLAADGVVLLVVSVRPS